MGSDRGSRLKATLFFAFALGVLTSCVPTFEKGSKSQEEFDRDNAQCIQENSTTTAARYGASHHTDWEAIRLTPETKIELVVRSQEPTTAGGWAGDFTALPLAPRELRPGDFVTVTGSAGRRAASSVSVVRPRPPNQARLPREHQ